MINTNHKNGKKRVILYGAGANLEKYIREVPNLLEGADGIIDKKKDDNCGFGVEILEPEYVMSMEANDFLVITSTKYYNEIEQEVHGRNPEIVCISIENYIQEHMPVTGHCNLCGADVKWWEWIGEDNHTPCRILGNGRRMGGCPYCKSYDRNRWLYYLLGKYTDMFCGKKKVLHFAPEKEVEKLLREKDNIQYYTADIQQGKAEYVEDITQITFENEEFDYIIANHVLEHIVNEKQAVTELKRCLKPDGILIISFPICLELENTDENRNYGAAERKKFYGQQDHVRLYGKDYIERFQNYGLKLKIYQPYKEMTLKEVSYNGLVRDDVLIFAGK